jgi:predicted dinucleotide-binding enzyme
MKIAVLGTGMVGRTLAPAFQRLGHDVVVGTRDPAATRAREEWTPDVPLAPYREVADGADVVVNATNGKVSLIALGMVGAEPLAGKVLLDVANRLDSSEGPDSLAEEIQRAFPDALVAKTLNTVNCAVMVDPSRAGDGDTTIFVASDHAEARRVARELLAALGWRDVIEFGELSAARGLELWVHLWVRLMRHFGTPNFNLKLER